MSLIAIALTIVALLLFAADIWRYRRSGRFSILSIAALVILALVAFAP